MRQSARCFVVACLAVVALIAGCSEQPLVPPADSTAQVPLYDHAAGAKYIDDSYIVVFTDDVAAADKSIDAVAQEYGITSERRSKHCGPIRESSTSSRIRSSALTPHRRAPLGESTGSTSSTCR